MMDNRTIATSEYDGGGHWRINIVDFLAGKIIASVEFYGPFFPPNASYVPAFTEYQDSFTFFVVTRTSQPKETKTSFADNGSEFVRLFPIDKLPAETYVMYRAWMPGTNRMLVQAYRYNSDYTKIEFTGLFVWDIDQNSYDLSAPGGEAGLFSPDGKKLAIISLGPIALNKDTQISSLGNGKVQIDNQYLLVDGKVETDSRYLQVLDSSSGKVFLQIPVTEEVYYHPQIWQRFESLEPLSMVFSPDSRYLAFLTPGEIRADETGQPIEVISRGEGLVNLNVVDLDKHKLVLSARMTGGIDSSYFKWSHNRDRLVYTDQSQNWFLWDAADGLSVPLTLSGGEQVYAPRWSFDDKYLRFGFFLEEPAPRWSVVVLEAPGAP